MLFKSGKCCERSPLALLIGLTATLAAGVVAFLLKAQDAPPTPAAGAESPAASGDATIYLWIAIGSAAVLVLVAAGTVFARWRETHER